MSDVIYNISSGFFDSVNGDRLYSAGDMNKPYKRVIADGIFPTPQGTPSTDFQVVAVSGMSVAVLAGNAMIGARWAENTDDVGITIAGNSSSSPRIDSIFLHIDTGMDTRAAGVVYRQGTAAGTPTAPAMVQTDNITELRLADILVAPSAAIITQANITDQRGGSDCPWVAGLIQQVDTSALFDQYRAAYAEQQQDQAAEWNTFMDHLARDYDISMSLRKHESTYTSTAAASLIPINIDGYDTTKDLLQVYINGIFAVEGTHYIVKSAAQIQLTNAISAGQNVHFVIYKAVMGGAQPIIPTDEQVQDAVDAYMDAHPGALVVDPELSDTSTHAIQNKAVTEALAGVNGRLGELYNNVLSDAWVIGGINSNTGAMNTYNTRLRIVILPTTDYFNVSADGDYYIDAGVWVNGTFAGLWTGEECVVGAEWQKFKTVDISKIVAKTNPSQIIIVIQNGTNTALDKDDAESKVYFGIPNYSVKKTVDAQITRTVNSIPRSNPNILYQLRPNVNGAIPPESKWYVKYAYDNQYDRVRLDVEKTSDGHYVLIHDTTINNVARNKDGSAISETVASHNQTLEVLNSYDWGIKYGEQYAGATVPTLDESLNIAAAFNLGVTLHLKFSPTGTECEEMCALLAKYGVLNNCIVATSAGYNFPTMNKFKSICPKLSFYAGGTPSDLASVIDNIKALKTAFNRVYLQPYPIGALADGDLQLLTMTNNLDLYCSWILGASDLEEIGFRHGYSVLEVQDVVNIKEYVIGMANALVSE